MGWRGPLAPEFNLSYSLLPVPDKVKGKKKKKKVPANGFETQSAKQPSETCESESEFIYVVFLYLKRYLITAKIKRTNTVWIVILISNLHSCLQFSGDHREDYQGLGDVADP